MKQFEQLNGEENKETPQSFASEEVLEYINDIVDTLNTKDEEQNMKNLELITDEIVNQMKNRGG